MTPTKPSSQTDKSGGIATAPSPRMATATSVEHPLVIRVRHTLALEVGKRYGLGLIRVSQKGNIEKLDDQRGTGVNVYDHLPDFASLRVLPIDVATRDWMAIGYQDVNSRSTKRSVFGWVGLVGETLFVAVADSALTANLPGDPDDPAQIGRNAYVDLVTAVALAGRVCNIYAPFRSRWWRSDLYANQLMSAINRWLPGATLWEGDRKVATTGAEKLITDVVGRTDGSGNAEALAEQTFTKGLEHLAEGNQWDRREAELPLGLGRERILRADGTTGKSKSVVETRWRAVAQVALAMRARGESWEKVGVYLAAEKVPMCGTRAQGRTFANYAAGFERTAAARQRLLRHIDWYRTGELIVRRTTKLERDELRGHVLEFDSDTGRRYRDVSVTLPWTPYLTDAQWEDFDRQEAIDAARREASRATGAAAHQRPSSAPAFRGVPRWEGVNTLAADSPTSYRWRYNGAIEATLRRRMVHRAAGLALLEGLRSLDRAPTALSLLNDGQGSLREFEERLLQLDGQIAEKRSASEAADDEVLRAKRENRSDREVDHWRRHGEQLRNEMWRVEEERESVAASVTDVRESLQECIELRQADVTQQVLLASLLAEGDQRVNPIVADACERYGITGTLRCRWDDGVDAGGSVTTRGRLVRFEAAATVSLLDGSVVRLPLSWAVVDSHGLPGAMAFVPLILRLWAEGKSYDEIVVEVPGWDEAGVRRQIRRQLRVAGVTDRALRASLLAAPVIAPRAIIAARALGDPSLARPYSPALIEEMASAYLGSSATTKGAWCDTARLDDDRRVLEVLAGPELVKDGMDISALARNAGVSRGHLYQMTRRRLVEKVTAYAVRARRCTYQDPAVRNPCGGTLTIYTPAPEAGLICAKCWRPDGRSGQLGEEYTRRWRRTTDGTYEVAPVPAVSPGVRGSDRTLTVAEVANRLELSASGVRQLDRDGILSPDSRDGVNSGRLYSLSRIEALSATDVERWRERFTPRDESELLSTADVVALLGVSPKLVREIVRVGCLSVAESTPGGHRRYRRADVDRIERASIEAFQYRPIGEAAREVGLTTTTLRRLAERGRVHSYVTATGHRRFDLGRLKEEVHAFNPVIASSNDLVGIGEFAGHAQVRLSTAQIRGLTNAGLIRSEGRIGGKRRYRLADALADVEEGRRRGVVPEPRDWAS